MLLAVRHILDSKKLVLASRSLGRQELIKHIGLHVILCPSNFEENLNPKSFLNIEEFVEETALQKVLEVDSRLKTDNSEADIVIGADTMVTCDSEIYGKPKNDQDAFNMLSRYPPIIELIAQKKRHSAYITRRGMAVTLFKLSGDMHTVYTGVVVKYGPVIKKFTEKTNVFMAKLTDEQIWEYISSGEPSDKAGAYAIQGIGGTIVERIEGDYFTVIGLPLHRLSSCLYDLLKNELK